MTGRPPGGALGGTPTGFPGGEKTGQSLNLNVFYKRVTV